jgi:hypothetical protein
VSFCARRALFGTPFHFAANNRAQGINTAEGCMEKLPSFLAVTVVATLACHDISIFQPSLQNVSGSYTARTIMKIAAFPSVDWIARGATMTITLTTDGATTGRLFVPGGADSGGDLDADMVGRWQLIGSTVQFGQTADTFVPEIDFSATSNRLSADQTLADGTEVRIVLTK